MILIFVYRTNLLLLSGGSLAAANNCLCSNSCCKYTRTNFLYICSVDCVSSVSVSLHGDINDLFLILVDEVTSTMMMAWFTTSDMSRCVVKAPVAWSIM